MNGLIKTAIITDYLTANHLTKKEFCRQCKISTSTLYKIMHGKNFYLSALFRIARIMNMQAYQLFN